MYQQTWNINDKLVEKQYTLESDLDRFPPSGKLLKYGLWDPKWEILLHFFKTKGLPFEWVT